MALRDKLAARSQPYLEPGEQIQHVFFAQTGPNPWFYLLTYLIFFWIKFRVVAVTDRAIVVLESKKLYAKPTGKVLARLPRTTRIGPLSGLWGDTHATGERLWVHKRFHKDVAAADAALGAGGAASAGGQASAAAAPGWYPDPAGGGGSRYWDGTAWTEHRHNG